MRVFIAFILLALRAQALDVVFEESSYAPGTMIRATVDAGSTATKILVENDVTGTSSQLEITGSKVLDLGKPQAPGFYRITFRDKIVVRSAVVPVFEGLKLTPAKPQIERPKAEALEKAIGLITRERMKRTWQQWDGKTFFVKKVVAIGTATSFGIACVSGGLPACVVAESAAFDVTTDFTVELLIAYTKVLLAEKAITAGEQQLAEAALRAGKVLLGVVTGAQLGEKIFAAVHGSLTEVLDATVSDGTATIGVNLASDEARKIFVLISRLKP